MPDLYIIAGPNGAGKSTSSSVLVPVGLEVFDADKLLAQRERLYPDINPALIMQGINEVDFEEQTSEAIRAKKDFAYETNFVADVPLAKAQEFRKAGYQINFIYIGLPSVKTAEARVARRRSMGGMDVDKAEIRYRYVTGLKNLQKYVGFFDRALLLNSENKRVIIKPREVLRLEKGVVIRRDTKLPKWAEKVAMGLPVKKEISQKMDKGRKR